MQGQAEQAQGLDPAATAGGTRPSRHLRAESICAEGRGRVGAAPAAWQTAPLSRASGAANAAGAVPTKPPVQVAHSTAATAAPAASCGASVGRRDDEAMEGVGGDCGLAVKQGPLESRHEGFNFFGKVVTPVRADSGADSMAVPAPAAATGPSGVKVKEEEEEEEAGARRGGFGCGLMRSLDLDLTANKPDTPAGACRPQARGLYATCATSGTTPTRPPSSLSRSPWSAVTRDDGWLSSSALSSAGSSAPLSGD